MPKTEDVAEFLEARGGQLPDHGTVDALQRLVELCQDVQPVRRQNRDDEATKHMDWLLEFKHLPKRTGGVDKMNLAQLSEAYRCARGFVADSEPKDILGMNNPRHHAALAFIEAVRQYVKDEAR